MGGPKILVAAGLLVLVLACEESFAVGGPFKYDYSIPVPKWSIQGLDTDGTNVFALWDDSALYTLDSNDGHLISSTDLSSFGCGWLGLAYNGTNLFALHSSYGGVDSYVYEIDPQSGIILNSFSVGYGEYISATIFDGNLYLSGFSGGGFAVFDTTNGNLLSSFSSWSYHGLTAYGSTLIGAVGYSGLCVEIDPYTGERLNSFRLNTFSQGIRGLAWDGTRLFVSGIVGYNSGAPGYIDVYERLPNGTPWACAFVNWTYNGSRDVLDGSWSSGSSSVLSWLWDLNADGLYDDASGVTPDIDYGSLYTIPDIGLKVTTSDGAEDFMRIGNVYFRPPGPTIPEPGTVALIAPALLAFAGIAVRRMRK